jgi:hypothetical protein
VVYRSLYSATVASQSLPNGFPYCYRPILSIDINRTWAHHAIFRLHTCDMATARRGPPAFVTIVSTAHAHSRRTTSSRPQEIAESRVQREQTQKTVRLRPSGSRNSVHTVRATTKERHCNTARRCTPEGALTLSEHARAFHAKMGRGKLQLQPQRPHGGGRAEKSATPRRKRDFSDLGANDICDTRHATTQIYYRRDRASTTTRVPKDPYHSRKMTTRRCDFRHQPSAGCTYSSSAVLRATSGGVS